MTEAVYFVVDRNPEGEHPCIYYERLPPEVSKRMVYGLRLDLLPNAAQFHGASTAQLYTVYCQLRDANKLPDPNLVPPTIGASAQKGRKLGDWWTQPEMPWDRSAPPVHRDAAWSEAVAQHLAALA